ncbi:glycosyltransferase family 4 protein [Mycobacterium sp. NAZ190054]|uniref:glycosyltransferase family 4 protein n=1 Tax=Mycobacterium sp. NAZ190054 TaxID=1747766 RepID=UPI0009E76E8D|nr:glycosyltransferase family 4 protein [Mycobacterium sp. NAZ190054]
MSYGRAGGRKPVALIVGPGDRFLSGVSYYTALLTEALAERGPVAALLLRNLCPRMLYPGRARVGHTDGMLPPPKVSVFNGLDWFWGPSAVGAWRFWRRTAPSVVILQWWTATVLHSYLIIAWLAKRAGARLVIEFHEMQDIGEAKLPLVARYTRAGMGLLLDRADAVVVHSEFDRRELVAAYPRLADMPVEVILHGPYAHHAGRPECGCTTEPQVRQPVRILIFGVVRPYKGHADLADAVGLLVGSGLDIHLSVVGEVWQGYRQPLDRLRAVLPADRLTIVDRYVADDEVPGFFAAADLVVLPYRRSSASGPLHIAMSCGLPVVTTSVGGLVEATEGYTGAVLVPPGDPAALADGIRKALPLLGRTHPDPHSWRRSAERYQALLSRVDAGWARPDSPPQLVPSGSIVHAM